MICKLQNYDQELMEIEEDIDREKRNRDLVFSVKDAKQCQRNLMTLLCILMTGKRQ